MPYIEKPYREELDKAMLYLVPSTEGELNYVITKIAHTYLKRYGKNYKTLNAIIGVFECAKTELYRRIIGVYEDEKIKENGDIE